MAKRMITKEAFLTAMECTTQGWYLMRDNGSAPTPGEQLRMEEGKEVHRRAQSLHPNGVYAGKPASTKQLILDSAIEVIFEAAFEVDRYRDATQNLGTHFKRIINRAGITPWPRLFNAMRASRVTELAAEYPSAVCTSWMGHTRAVAEAHYHMVRDEDYEKAASEPTLAPGQRTSTQSVAKSGALVSQNASHSKRQRLAIGTK